MLWGDLGCITSPAQNSLVRGVPWCADNGRFGNGWPGYYRWARWLDRQPRARCWFTVAPDVPYNAAATLRQFGPAARLIRRLGFPVALAAQDGLERLPVPWDDMDVLFLAGSTDWKLGPAAQWLAAEAQARRPPVGVHLARVNSWRRWRHADALGCMSCDGTFLAHGPDRRLPEVLNWARRTSEQPGLWRGAL